MAELKLKAVTRTQGNNRALKDGSVKPKTFAFDFVEVDPLIDAFRRMVRGLEFDICEMAITTYICARAHGKRDDRDAGVPGARVPPRRHPGQHQGGDHHAQGSRRQARRRQPRLHGDHRRVGAQHPSGRAGVDLSKITWVLSGDEHVAEYGPPPNVVPIEKGKKIDDMLASGELAAAIGVEVDHPDVKPLIPNALDAGLDGACGSAATTRSTTRW